MSKVAKKITDMSQEELLAHAELQEKQIAELQAKLSDSESNIAKAKATIEELNKQNESLDKVKGIKKPVVTFNKKTYVLRHAAFVKVNNQVVKADAESIKGNKELCQVLIKDGLLKEV